MMTMMIDDGHGDGDDDDDDRDDDEWWILTWKYEMIMTMMAR